MGAYELSLVPCFAEVIVDETISDKVRGMRFNALMTLQAQLNHYKKLGYVDELIDGIAEKKSGMIMKVTSKTEMDRVLQPHAPRYDGCRFIPDEYLTPEEELIAWSQTSLKGPLVECGQRRFSELFKQLFPDKSKEIFT